MMTPYDILLFGKNTRQLYNDIVYTTHIAEPGKEVFFLFSHLQKESSAFFHKNLAYLLNILKKNNKQKSVQPLYFFFFNFYKKKRTFCYCHQNFFENPTLPYNLLLEHLE